MWHHSQNVCIIGRTIEPSPEEDPPEDNPKLYGFLESPMKLLLESKCINVCGWFVLT